MILNLLANTPPVKVVPLFPPHPTSMTPTFGIRVSVLNVKFVIYGFAMYLSPYFSMLVDLYSYVDVKKLSSSYTAVD